MMNYMYLSLSLMLIRWLLASNMIPSHSLEDSYSSVMIYSAIAEQEIMYFGLVLIGVIFCSKFE